MYHRIAGIPIYFVMSIYDYYLLHCNNWYRFIYTYQNAGNYYCHLPTWLQLLEFENAVRVTMRGMQSLRPILLKFLVSQGQVGTHVLFFDV